MGVAEEMMGFVVVWKRGCTTEPLGAVKFLLPDPMQTCSVKRYGMGSTGHAYGLNLQGIALSRQSWDHCPQS